MNQVTETIKMNFNEDVDTEIESFGESPQNVLSTSSSVSDDLVFSKRKYRGRTTGRYKRIKISRNRKKPNGAFNGRRLFNRKKNDAQSRSQDLDEKQEDEEDKAEQSEEQEKEEKEVKIEDAVETDNLMQKEENQNSEEKPQKNVSTLGVNDDISINNGLKENKDTVKELVIDTVQVTRIMNKVIDMTKNCTVEQLEEIYSCIYRVIVKGQQDWDRNQLVRVRNYHA